MHEHTELARHLLSVWSSGNREQFLELVHPRCRFWPSGVFPDTRDVYEGLDGMARFWEDLHGAWRFTVEPVLLEEVAGKVVAQLRLHAVARDGLQVERRLGAVIELEEGKLAALRSFASWSGALASVGL
jgi:ketosteroid isomerase-like protein